MKALLDDVRVAYPDLSVPVSLFLDNARYQKSYEIQDYAKTLNICLEYIPPYSPNLNLIERLWKFTRKKVILSEYYETFDALRNALITFF
jgi:transposase